MKVEISISSGMMLFSWGSGVLIMNIYTSRVTTKIEVTPQEETQALIYYYTWLCAWYDNVIGEEVAAA